MEKERGKGKVGRAKGRKMKKDRKEDTGGKWEGIA